MDGVAHVKRDIVSTKENKVSTIESVSVDMLGSVSSCKFTKDEHGHLAPRGSDIDHTKPSPKFHTDSGTDAISSPVNYLECLTEVQPSCQDADDQGSSDKKQPSSNGPTKQTFVAGRNQFCSSGYGTAGTPAGSGDGDRNGDGDSNRRPLDKEENIVEEEEEVEEKEEEKEEEDCSKSSDSSQSHDHSSSKQIKKQMCRMMAGLNPL